MAFFREDHEKQNMAERYVIGLDLKEENSQISYFEKGSEKPVTVSLTVGDEDYAIPTVLCRRYEVNQWYFGRTAVAKAQQHEGILIKNLVSKAEAGQKVSIEGEEYFATDLLALFVKRCFTLLPTYIRKDRILTVMITVEQLSQGMVDALTRCIEVLGLPKEQVLFNACAESFFCYMVHQDSKLWEHETLLFDFTKAGVKAYRMALNHGTRPVVAMVSEKLYQNFVILEEEAEEGRLDIRKSPAELDQDFLAIAKEQLDGHIVDAVYLLGRGFSTDWSKNSINYLCQNRKVYQGNNLFSNGAAYAAMDRVEPEAIHKDYVYLGGDKIRSNLGMHVLRKGSEAYMALLDAGVNWYETGKDVELLLEGGNELTFIITPISGGKLKQQKISLEEYSVRTTKTNRIHMHIEPLSPVKVKITVTDMGFGEIFPSSGKIWVKEIDLCE